MKILVTGGAGFIGSHACKLLAQSGHEPIAYDNLRTGHRWAVQFGPFEHGAIGDRERLDDVLARHKPDAVMHFAALAYVGESVTHPGQYYRTNTADTLTLLDAMRGADVRNIVFSSTCAIFGEPDRMPISEDTAKHPVNPYGQSKLAVEHILRDYRSAYGINFTALRYFNAAGCDPAGILGEEHDPETHLLPLILHAASGQRDAITIFGDDYDTRDGTCVRDYIHVEDLCSAHLLALERTAEGQSGHFNLGNGNGTSVREAVDAAARVTGKDIPTRIGDRRPGDPPTLVADASHARETLGWKPQYEDIETMIKHTWDWQQEHRYRYILKDGEA
ncbi:UDP-glucose 4-epimerase GalE [Aurantiacibacter sediminis]|uniref:UDP-glucose 4-epimerase n=1 Tax=Aurantiacibacter sediminis TaxID=2793064 RepID=A0ABS0N4M5_9SPHN|nr:UDP-glucose 4-epimerase GalE [Aurantiacibacter sediminis]MBH5322436.1 UDP-glucose 4-epimerase GalE [Aurantiacibacter sediminis]